MEGKLTGDMLADWAEQALAHGARYWYGTCWYRATNALLARKRAQYPAHYTEKRMAAYESHIAAEKMVCDCVGLIKGFFWTENGARENAYRANNCPDVSADGMLALCRETGALPSLPEVRGVVLWKKGHIGVYVGGGKAIEARGFAQGVVKTSVAGRGWQRWGYLPGSMLAYGTRVVSAEPVLRCGMRGADVGRMQVLLLKWDAGALPAWGADGQFGKETRNAVMRFQKACGITVDGIVGQETWRCLKEGA